MSFYKEIENSNRDKSDRYRNCNILQEDDIRFLATRDIVDIPKSTSDSYHTVTANEEGRLDLISFQYYKSSLFWWVIAQANDIHDPITYPKTGDIVRVPSLYVLYGDNGVLL